MNIPCNHRSLCQDPADPFQNFSSEDYDVDHFFCLSSGIGSVQLRPGESFNPLCQTIYGPVVAMGNDADGCALYLQEINSQCDDPGCTTQPCNPPPNCTTCTPIVVIPDNPDDPTKVRYVNLFFNTEVTCSKACPDGSYYWWTIPPGRYISRSVNQANSMARSEACRQAEAHLSCMSNIAGACLNQAYSQTISITGRLAQEVALYWKLEDGTIPPGLTFDDGIKYGHSTTLIGTPTATGHYAFTLRATAPDGMSYVQRAYSMNVMAVNPTTLPDATAEEDYSYQILVEGFEGPVEFITDPDQMPAWLTVSSTGLAQGTPESADSGIEFNFDVTIRDSDGLSCVQHLKVTVLAVGGVPATLSVSNSGDWDNLLAQINAGGIWTVVASRSFTLLINTANIKVWNATATINGAPTSSQVWNTIPPWPTTAGNIYFLGGGIGPFDLGLIYTLTPNSSDPSGHYVLTGQGGYYASAGIVPPASFDIVTP